MITTPTHINMAKFTPIRKTTRMAKKGRTQTCPTTMQAQSPTSTKTTSQTKSTRCMRPGPVQRNPYLNFLREFRKQNCGLSVVETVRKGAQAWKNLPQEQKNKFIIEAYYAPKLKRRRRLWAPIGRRRRVAKQSHSAKMKKTSVKKMAHARRPSRMC